MQWSRAAKRFFFDGRSTKANKFYSFFRLHCNHSCRRTILFEFQLTSCPMLPRLKSIRGKAYDRATTNLRRDTLGWLNSNGRIPFARWKHSDAVQELVDAREKIVSIASFVRDVVKHLHAAQSRKLIHKMHTTHTQIYSVCSA